MSEAVNPITGEVSENPEEIGLVPLNLAAMSEEALLELFPTPIQAAGALIRARETAARAPRALNAYRTALRKAERTLQVELALALRRLASEFPRSTMTERKLLASSDEKVREAQDRHDEAWLLLEYARDYDKAIGRDIDILRSLNANFRGEHK